MGDRCFVRMKVRSADLPRFEEIFGAKFYNELEEASPGVLELTECEANYGRWDDRREAAAAGLVFIGWHGAGGDYGPRRFAAFGGRQVEVRICPDSDEIVVPVGPSGRPNRPALGEVRRYRRMLRQAESYLRGGRRVRR